MSVSLHRWLVSMHRKLVQLCGIGRKHTNLSVKQHPRKSRWDNVSIYPGFPGQKKAYSLKNPHPQERTGNVDQEYA